MAICEGCGTEIGIFNTYGPYKNLCGKCNAKRPKEPEPTRQVLSANVQMDIEKIVLTTETYPEGLKIIKRIEIVTAEWLLG